MQGIPERGNDLETEPSFADAANYRFENLYRVNWIEKLPDYQYQCLHLPFYQICDTFDSKSSYRVIEKQKTIDLFAISFPIFFGG